MKILGLGMPELIIILIVILLIFGPKNLPKLGSAIGRTVKNLREGMDEKKTKKEEEAGTEATNDAEAPAGATEAQAEVEDAGDAESATEPVVEEDPLHKKDAD